MSVVQVIVSDFNIGTAIQGLLKSQKHKQRTVLKLQQVSVTVLTHRRPK